MSCRAGTVIVPIMASRLMLSLKKAVADSKVSWSPSVMADPSQRRPVGGFRSKSGVPGGLDGVPETFILPSEEDTEPESSRDNNPSTPRCSGAECRCDFVL